MNEAIIGFAGVLVGSFITVFKDLWTSYRERYKEGSYSAIRLISILEAYADRCIDIVYDDGTAYGRPAGRADNGEEYAEAQEETPSPLDFPDDIVWRSLDEGIVHRIVALPNKARRTNRYIGMSVEGASPPYYEDYFDARQEGYARLGAEALEIVGELRRRFRISANSGIHMTTEWDPAAFLGKTIQKFDTERAELDAWRAEKAKEVAT
ncbi:hypothetical protein SAMN05444413_104245 [Roseivivax marinus]|uniref:hypothetical protein n=1 Tax=Roseivivax marinus TaxID=1379903 RepID=UPI0008C799A6|nr:hypothetical protein [Roseivivax marinus]SEK94858.1 hypothetical protein SAMN05444413_104245 [Roseivivax marinus]